jgi:uncharacterized protein (TIGR03435 family)
MIRMTGWTVCLSFAALLTAPAGFAQSNAPRPAFDVTSVKLNTNCQTGGGGRAGISPRNLALPCVSLRALIGVAYGDMLVGAGIGARRMEALGGPGWLDTDRYDILAKSEGNAPAGQSAAPMLQTLLEDRFKVKVHKEARDSSVYILTVAKGGAKLQASQDGSCTPLDLSNLGLEPPKQGAPAPKYCGSGRMKNGGSRMVADWYGVTMAELAGRMLSSYVEQPVVDQTGLTGRFDVHIEFVPDYRRSGPVTLNGVVTPDVAAPPADPAGPSIFAALQEQLGLKLAPGKAPLDVLIVDHAEKPSAN